MLLAPMARRWRRAGRLDGQRPLAGGALRPGAPAVLLLQAAVRAGHEPADRPDPRGDRDEPRDDPRAASATCSTRPPSTRTSSCSTSRSCSTASSRRCATSRTSVFAARTIDITWPLADGARLAWRRRWSACADQAHEAIDEGANIIVLSDRRIGPGHVPIPSLLAVAAVHHHLVREGTRLRAGIVARVGRAARGAPLRHADRLRRERDQPVPDARDARRARAEREPHARERPEQRRQGSFAEYRGGRPEHDQSDRQRALEDDLEDGHLHDPVLPRRADLRGGRARAGADRPPLHRHRLAHRRRRAGRAGERGAGASRARVPGAAGRAAAGRRGVRVAARRRAPHVEPGDDRARPARGARGQRRRRRRARGRRAGARGVRDERGVREVPRVRERDQRGRGAQGDAARAAGDRRRRRAAASRRPAGAGRAGERDRAALLHRRDEPRLDLARGARDAGDRDEPARRALEHGRGRRGSRRASRPTRTATGAARRSSRSPPGASA